MIDTHASRQCLSGQLTHFGLVGLGLATLLGLACGLQAHPTSGSQSGGSGGQVGSGGQSQGSGGQTTESGGQTTGSGTRTASSGGQTTGTGGQSAASGGQTTGSGGQTAGSGGRTAGSGGQTTGTGGQSAASGGQTTGSGGQTAGSGGRTAGSGGQTTASGGVSGTGGKSTGTGGASTGGSSGSGGASGAGVTINGKFVPKDKAVVFIHFGHSNMRGAATTPTSLTSYFYNTEDGLWSYKGSFALAKEPTAPQAGYTSAGPGMAILHSARGAVAATSEVQFISVGYGQGSATTVDYQKSGIYYPSSWAGQASSRETSPLGRSSLCWGSPTANTWRPPRSRLPDPGGTAGVRHSDRPGRTQSPGSVLRL